MLTKNSPKDWNICFCDNYTNKEMHNEQGQLVVNAYQLPLVSANDRSNHLVCSLYEVLIFPSCRGSL